MFRAVLTDRLQAAFTAAGIALPEGFVPSVVIASDTRYGDYQSNAAMVLSKQLKQNPRALAQQIVDQLQVTDLCEKISIDGPGFLNFTVSPTALIQRLSVILEDDHVGVPPVTQPKRIVIDFSAPNIAKPMHVGHIRSTFIGDSLARVARFIGHTVITDNHVGDWGTQFGYLLAAIEDSPTPPWEDAEPVAAMMKMYAEFYQASEEDPDKKTRARAWFRKLEEGDVWARSIWQKLVDISMTEFDTIYKRLGISFDTTLGESWFEPMLGPLVDDAIAKGVATIEESGAVSVHFDDKYPSCLLRKTDGATLYQTRDAATCIHRWNTYAPTRNVYVVGA
jgi:arginyl-tRNA synthetase